MAAKQRRGSLGRLNRAHARLHLADDGVGPVRNVVRKYGDADILIDDHDFLLFLGQKRRLGRTCKQNAKNNATNDPHHFPFYQQNQLI